MNTKTMAIHAVTRLASARLRPANVLLADAVRQGRGTTVSFAGSTDLRGAVAGVPFPGSMTRHAVIAVLATYKTPDVARSRFGRPPV